MFVYAILGVLCSVVMGIVVVALDEKSKKESTGPMYVFGVLFGTILAIGGFGFLGTALQPIIESYTTFAQVIIAFLIEYALAGIAMVLCKN